MPNNRSQPFIRVPAGTTHLAADLLVPEGEGPHPAVLMAHGFASLRRARLPAYAERFRRAGFVVLLFDYRHFGDSGGEPRQLLSVRRQIEDWHAALQFARDLPQVDADRVALWGTSYSGGHVIRVAARDRRVAAVVSQLPFVSGTSTLLRLPPLSSLRVILAAAADVLRSAVGGEPVMVGAAGSPGAAAVMALDGAVEGVRRLHEGLEWENRVTARSGPAGLFYRPARDVRRVLRPLLVQVAERDTLTPPSPAERMARRAPNAEFHAYPAGHFDAYYGEVFEAMVAAQEEFLVRHVRDASGRRWEGDPERTEAP